MAQVAVMLTQAPLRGLMLDSSSLTEVVVQVCWLVLMLQLSREPVPLALLSRETALILIPLKDRAALIRSCSLGQQQTSSSRHKEEKCPEIPTNQTQKSKVTRKTTSYLKTSFSFTLLSRQRRQGCCDYSRRYWPNQDGVSRRVGGSTTEVHHTLYSKLRHYHALGRAWAS